MMRLSDIVGRLNSPTVLISVALILFFAVFLAVVAYAYVLLGKGAAQQMAAMPLEDHTPLQPRSLTNEDDKKTGCDALKQAVANGGERQ